MKSSMSPEEYEGQLGYYCQIKDSRVLSEFKWVLTNPKESFCYIKLCAKNTIILELIVRHYGT